MILDVVALFLTGFVSLVGQIVLLRELNVAFFGVELIYLIALGVWLLLAAVGTLAGRRKASPDWTATLFLFFAFCLPLGVVFLRASRLVLGGVPGAYLPFSWQRAALVLALPPGGPLSGLLARTAAGRDQIVARLGRAGNEQASRAIRVLSFALESEAGGAAERQYGHADRRQADDVAPAEGLGQQRGEQGGHHQRDP